MHENADWFAFKEILAGLEECLMNPGRQKYVDVWERGSYKSAGSN
jgi:hypothetical protein